MRRNNGIRGWGAITRDLRGQQSPFDDTRSGDRASAGSDSRWWFGGGSQDGQGGLTPAVGIDFTSSARSAGGTAHSASTVLTEVQIGSSQGLGIRWQETPHSRQAQLRQTDHTPLHQQQQQQQWQRQTPYMSARWGLTTPPTIARLEASPLLYRSTALFSSREIQGGRAVGEEEIKKAMRKVLGCEEVAFRSEEQREALRVIVSSE